jgi:arylsulfatase A-like enzyme
VLIILLDDLGFGAPSVLVDRATHRSPSDLAANGLKYTRFHTCALCAPSRQALLTGRNHHTVGMGCLPELATSAPGYSSIRPNTCAPLAETLKLNGYATAQFGKCHEVPLWQTSPMGPFGGVAYRQRIRVLLRVHRRRDQPVLPGSVRRNPADRARKTPEEGYHFTEDMTDKAINWVRQQKALMPDKPFFVYFAPGATHAPHHVPPEWSAKYKGKFDQGWDKLREETFARQKQLGVIPPEAELTKRHSGIPAWDDIPVPMRPILARQMEVYAGFLEHTDYHIGRLIDALEDLEILDDTLIYYITGDNGASAEGNLQGALNEMITMNTTDQTLGLLQSYSSPEYIAEHIDEFGSPKAFNIYAVGWAHAMDTPYQWTKQVASHWGGTRNGTIVHWPNGIQAKGEVRNQFHHVIDVAPTILEAAGLPEPVFVNGIQQKPYEGVSMAYSFDDARAAERHEDPVF